MASQRQVATADILCTCRHQGAVNGGAPGEHASMGGSGRPGRERAGLKRKEEEEERRPGYELRAGLRAREMGWRMLHAVFAHGPENGSHGGDACPKANAGPVPLSTDFLTAKWRFLLRPMPAARMGRGWLSPPSSLTPRPCTSSSEGPEGHPSLRLPFLSPSPNP